ncbi:diaminobutyrate acetyltransferase [Lipingzhangella sp. LS1_29]|uniref:L-2,4-diaminobutyric acid acetyltransferase n=1 Tax=Lipingzhangella rawalii TaxID=2055835 RepID=A0ABU2H3M6_9ACTN|nr:diaminobutyrate acetyltransferase [Lipingzhangella rawalii]MDS1269898.1 diaminobutyrate acetyltransferase [Lipingzhangella rawalii]
MERPTLMDGQAIYDLVCRAGLDVNSPYAYVLWCRDFAATTVVARGRTASGAETSPELGGFVLGYVRPEQPDTYFLWQVAVDPGYQGRKLARTMLHHIGDRCVRQGIRYLEATVTPDNAASRALFEAFARAHGVEARWSPLFERAHFPQPEAVTDVDQGHEREELVRIGPLHTSIAASS